MKDAAKSMSMVEIDCKVGKARFKLWDNRSTW